MHRTFTRRFLKNRIQSERAKLLKAHKLRMAEKTEPQPDKRQIVSQEGSEMVETFIKPEFLEKAKQNLTKEEYEVMVERGTERAFTGIYNRFLKDGKYHCKICDIELFKSENKFETTCGWPAFSKAEEVVTEKVDRSYGMERTETICNNCGAHLGHVFDDGPVKSGGMRYCINSNVMNFKPKDK